MIAVVDLGFGDAGKGGVVDALVREREADLVVRFNGGAQAGHNVVTDDGRHHCFSQFCAGTLAGAEGLLGPDFLLHPLAMWVEAEHLGGDPWAITRVDPRARVITPYQQAANRIREQLRGDAAHGTVGVGVGECVADSIAVPEETLRASDLTDVPKIRRILERQRERKRAELEALGADVAFFEDMALIDRVVAAWTDVASVLRLELAEDRIARAREVVFEGAQGVLLDQWWGFHPHTTWSDCTAAGVMSLTDREVYVLGVLRAYAVRHGPGPFPTEGLGPHVVEPHNNDDGWQGRFRTGAFDRVLLDYARKVCPVDGLAITCLDQVPDVVPVCVSYEEGPVPLGEREDLVGREQVTRWLGSVTPVLEPANPAQLPDVVCTRYGPTAAGMRIANVEPHDP